MAKAFFVVGTDTGVGKTMISCALLRAFSASGRKTVGMKPVVTGCVATESDDLRSLSLAGNVSAPREWVNPYAFESPIAPHLAADRAGITIDPDRIARAYRKLTELADVVVVEGIGGFRVPLNSRFDSADLVQLLGVPIILVVGMRLGCLNHALLTVEAVNSRNLRPLAWVANQLDFPLLGITPYVSPINWQALSASLDLDKLGL